LQASRLNQNRKLIKVFGVWAICGEWRACLPAYVGKVRGFFPCTAPDKKFHDLITRGSKHYNKRRYPAKGPSHTEFKGKALREN
jgi:hypothetical protein